MDTQSEQMLLENSTDRLALSRDTTDFQLVKNTVPANIVYCIKQNTLKYGMDVWRKRESERDKKEEE